MPEFDKIVPPVGLSDCPMIGPAGGPLELASYGHGTDTTCRTCHQPILATEWRLDDTNGHPRHQRCWP